MTNPQQDQTLDEILDRIENYYTMKYGMDYEENEKPMSLSEAKAKLLQWRDECLVKELEGLHGWIDRNHYQPVNESDRWVQASGEIMQKIQEIIKAKSKEEN